MGKTTYLKPFLPVFIFILVIIGIYVVGQSAFNPLGKGMKSANQWSGIGSTAPDFVIKDIYGSQAPLSFIYQKKPVLLIFWSTLCPYCAQELPGLLAFGNKYSGSIQIILIMSGESKQAVESYVSNKNIPFVSSLDTNRAAWQLYEVKGTPSHFLINTSGEIIVNNPGALSYQRLEDITRYFIKR